jgi:hypothetical protein
VSALSSWAPCPAIAARRFPGTLGTRGDRLARRCRSRSCDTRTRASPAVRGPPLVPPALSRSSKLRCSQVGSRSSGPTSCRRRGAPAGIAGRPAAVAPLDGTRWRETGHARPTPPSFTYLPSLPLNSGSHRQRRFNPHSGGRRLATADGRAENATLPRAWGDHAADHAQAASSRAKRNGSLGRRWRGSTAGAAAWPRQVAQMKSTDVSSSHQ